MSDDSWRGDGPKQSRKNFDDELRALLRADPFVAFEIVMPNGDSAKIEDPNSLDIGDVFLDVVLPKSGEVRLRKSAVIMIRLSDQPY